MTIFNVLSYYIGSKIHKRVQKRRLEKRCLVVKELSNSIQHLNYKHRTYRGESTVIDRLNIDLTPNCAYKIKTR